MGRNNNYKSVFLWMLPATSKGFTLIEVLVATVIMISSIAAITMIYRGVIVSSERAAANIQISSVVEATLGEIKEQIQTLSDKEITNLNGNGSQLNISYSWSAELLNFEAAPPTYDIDQARLIQPEEKYMLWSVTVSFSHKNVRKEYSYREVSWLEQ